MGSGRLRATVAVAGVFALAACEQAADVTGVAEGPAFLVVPTGTAQQVMVCKDVNAGAPAGEFDFDISNLSAGVQTPAGDPFTLVDEECTLAATSASSGASVTIEELAESGFTFDSVSVWRHNGATKQTTHNRTELDPQVTLTPFGPDGGWVVVFYNTGELPPPPDEGCTRTQGYWKTHASGRKFDETWNEVGGSGATFLHGMSYITVLNTAPKGDAWYILAHQYIAALLNQKAGANTSDVDDELAEALGILTANAPGSLKAQSATRDRAIELAGILDDYNNGEIGPGHCGEGEGGEGSGD
jgi:hypothetical protein